jgi:stress-induced morphogen
MDLELADVEALIEEHVPGADATVSRPRTVDENHEDAHLRAVVVSPAFEGRSLVDQHQLVYDALGDRMTRDIHALEIKTYTPEEYEAAGDTGE